MNQSKGTIGILTGGGDVSGLNLAIRAVTMRAVREGYRVLGIRRGWAGLVDAAPGNDEECVRELSEEAVNRAARTGGTFLHTSRTKPSALPRDRIPLHLRDRYGLHFHNVRVSSTMAGFRTRFQNGRKAWAIDEAGRASAVAGFYPRS